MKEAIVLAIRSGQVVVNHNGSIECLDWRAPEKQVAMSALPIAPPQATPGEPGDQVQKLSDSSYIIPQSEIDNTMTNLSQIATQARIIPNFSDGKPNGFKFFSIRPGSIYEKIGMANGDVIRSINGYEMSSPDKALEVYQKLRTAKSIQIQINRNGRDQTLNYTIR